VSFDVNRLYSLLPAFYRVRDVEVARQLGLDDDQGPLRAILSLIAEQAAVLEDDLAQLYDDLFIETCAEWVIPYIGELVSARGLFVFKNASFSQRALVANTIADRRRKGTAAGLEDLAHQVTGFPAAVVEYFQFLATTQYMNHIRPGNAMMPSLRDTEPLQYIGTPFDTTARTAEVRRIGSGRGKYNIPNIGIFLWRLAAQTTTNAPVFRASAEQCLFSALGYASVLLTRPEPEADISHLATPLNVPIPIGRRILATHLDSYYGRDKSIFITKNTIQVDINDVAACDLEDISPGNWAQPPGVRYLIDPELGRLLAPAGTLASDVIRVNYRAGFSADMGGGEYNRIPSFTPGLAPVVSVSASAPIQPALDGLSHGGVVEITDNEYYAETPSFFVPSQSAIEWRAADGQRPVLLLSDDLLVTGSGECDAILNGLVIVGGAVSVPLLDRNNQPNRLRTLRLRHCTLVPGPTPDFNLGGGAIVPGTPGLPRLIVEAPNVTVEIEDCIIGGIRATGEASISIQGSIIDGGGELGIAYSGLLGFDAGAPLEIQNSTVIGKVHTQTMQLASNTIFLAALEDPDFWTAPVIAERLQEGCVRFSFVPPGSRVPRKFHCQPEDASQAARLRPIFNSLRYGDAEYCQLSPHCAAEIADGADDQAEMGAFHDLFQPQRISNLRTRLDEYLRFGLEAGVFLAS
jgi:hypothetical protein